MSNIEWTDETWNPTTGCSRVSPGCDNCYMFALWPRLHAMRVNGYQGAPDELAIHESRLDKPFEWVRPRKIFVNSMSDLFHRDVPYEFIDRVFITMTVNPRHTFQVLTKRPGRVVHWWKESLKFEDRDWPDNVWIGTSVESQKYLPRARVLAAVPAKVRFLSVEPLLGPINLGFNDMQFSFDGSTFWHADGCGGTLDQDDECDVGCKGVRAKGMPFNWVIVGGESGPNARPMETEWVERIKAQCQGAFVPFFFKQWGGVNKKATGRLINGSEWNQFPTPQLSSV